MIAAILAVILLALGIFILIFEAGFEWTEDYLLIFYNSTSTKREVIYLRRFK